jgi:hypothetical protein
MPHIIDRKGPSAFRPRIFSSEGTSVENRVPPFWPFLGSFLEGHPLTEEEKKLKELKEKKEIDTGLKVFVLPDGTQKEESERMFQTAIERRFWAVPLTAELVSSKANWMAVLPLLADMYNFKKLIYGNVNFFGGVGSTGTYESYFLYEGKEIVSRELGGGSDPERGSWYQVTQAGKQPTLWIAYVPGAWPAVPGEWPAEVHDPLGRTINGWLGIDIPLAWQGGSGKASLWVGKGNYRPQPGDRLHDEDEVDWKSIQEQEKELAAMTPAERKTREEEIDLETENGEAERDVEENEAVEAGEARTAHSPEDFPRLTPPPPLDTSYSSAFEYRSKRVREYRQYLYNKVSKYAYRFPLRKPPGLGIDLTDKPGGFLVFGFRGDPGNSIGSEHPMELQNVTFAPSTIGAGDYGTGIVRPDPQEIAAYG